MSSNPSGWPTRKHPTGGTGAAPTQLAKGCNSSGRQWQWPITRCYHARGTEGVKSYFTRKSNQYNQGEVIFLFFDVTKSVGVRILVWREIFFDGNLSKSPERSCAILQSEPNQNNLPLTTLTALTSKPAEGRREQRRSPMRTVSNGEGRTHPLPDP